MMKKSYFLLTLAAAAALLLSSCTRPLPDRMDAFVDKVEQNADTYTEEDWELANEEFQKLYEEYKADKGSLTGDQVKQVREAMSRYVAKVVESGVSSVTGAIEEIGNQLPGFFEDLGNIFKGIGEGLSEGRPAENAEKPAKE